MLMGWLIPAGICIWMHMSSLFFSLMSTNDSEWRAGKQHYLSALDFINTKFGALLDLLEKLQHITWNWQKRGGEKKNRYIHCHFRRCSLQRCHFQFFFFLTVTSLGLGFELNSSPQKSAKGFCLFIQLPSGELNSIEQHFIHRADANKHSWSICSREVAVRSLSAEHACHSPGISEQKLTVRSIYLH